MARFFIENYGCQMNVSESDSLRNLLIIHHHEWVENPREAEVAIINTCSVRRTAEQRIVGRFGFYRTLNETEGRNIRVVLMGCMAQNAGLAMKKKFPDVIKLVWGTYNKEGVLEYLNSLRSKGNFLELSDYRFMDAQPQGKYPFKSFVPISHGCDNFCSYCIVPIVRGREVHRSAKDILANIQKLSDQGVKEINLLGQNVNSYRDGNLSFPELLDRIAVETKMERIGFLTSHPKDFSKELVDVVAAHSNIMKSIHLPLQSGSGRILNLMNRKYTTEEYLKKIEMARKIPDAALSTDILVGFPSETEKEFLETVELVKKVRYTEAFTYHYNVRPGTAAEKLPDQVPEKVKKERLSYLIETQRAISQEMLSAQIGNTLLLMLDSVSKKNPNELSGKSHNGISIFIEGKKEWIGQILPVKIEGVSGSGVRGKAIFRI
jgi:tRNA-2-methylthio-N6-dimethylallyladenosine synthase